MNLYIYSLMSSLNFLFCVVAHGWKAPESMYQRNIRYQRGLQVRDIFTDFVMRRVFKVLGLMPPKV